MSSASFVTHIIQKTTYPFQAKIFTKTRAFNEDLYGEKVTIYFIRKLRLRQEKKFDSADTLITKDIAEAKKVLAENPDCVDLSL